MKTSKFLSVVMSISAVWILLDVKSPAQGFKLELAVAKPTLAKFAPRHIGISPLQILRQNQDYPASDADLNADHLLVAQNLETTPKNSDVNQDFMLKDITITQNSVDKSLLTVTGFINNRSGQSHYVYYIVAKFISNDTAIKQTIIPVNIELEPGQSKPFIHEISTDSVKSVAPETVKPLVVKYEYR